MEKILYFEGAGCVEYNGLNCRMRTAFRTDDGKCFYAGFMCGYRYEEGKPELRFMAEHYISLLTSERGRVYSKSWEASPEEKLKESESEYRADNILKYINRACGTDFEKIVCLPDLAGYRVFNEDGETINLMNDFTYDPEMTDRRRAAVGVMKEQFRKLFHMRYDNTSYYIDDGKLMVRLNVSEEKRLAAGYKNRVFSVEV